MGKEAAIQSAAWSLKKGCSGQETHTSRPSSLTKEMKPYEMKSKLWENKVCLPKERGCLQGDCFQAASTQSMVQL